MNSRYYLSLASVFLTLGIFFFAFRFVYDIYKRKKIQRLLAVPFPKEYEDILEKIPLYRQLDTTEQEKIKRSILVFIDTKNFMGVSLVLNDEMKVVVAFHACLLLLHLNLSQCYENLSTIVIYPNTVIAQQVSNNGGIYTKGKFLLEGQSSGDTVVLSWNDIKKTLIIYIIMLLFMNLLMS